MLDRFMRRLIDPPLKTLATCLSPHVSANAVSLAGAGIAALAFLALSAQRFVVHARAHSHCFEPPP